MLLLIYMQFTFDVLPVIRVQNFYIGSRDPGYAHLWVILRFVRMKDPSSIYVLKLKQIGRIIQKLYGGPKISKVGHVT